MTAPQILELARRVASDLAADGAQSVVLAGSQIRDDATELSDIDLHAIGVGAPYALRVVDYRLVAVSWRCAGRRSASVVVRPPYHWQASNVSSGAGHMDSAALGSSALIATIPVRDRARAQAFYVEVLGLSLEATSAAGVLLRVDDGRILLYESAAPAPQHTLAGFEVPELEPIMDQLRGRGVSFEDYDFPGLRTVDQVAWIGPERAAWFRDSEGNVLSISEPWREDRTGGQ